MKALEIIGLIITFIAFAVIGYCLPIAENESQIKEDSIAAASTVTISQVDTSVSDIPEIVADSIQVADITKKSIPQNITTQVGIRNPRYHARIGLPLTVTAETESGDALECLIKNSESSDVIIAQAAMTDGKCIFADIKPVDGGTYYVSVRNTVSGETAGKYVTGFDKISKWSAAELTEHLNAPNWEDQFFFHLAEERLKFDCEGIDPTQSDIPDTVNRLLSKKESLGWVFTVTETPQYDQYNRITYFKVNITISN